VPRGVRRVFAARSGGGARWCGVRRAGALGLNSEGGATQATVGAADADRCALGHRTTPVELDERLVAGVLGANVERAADPAGVLRGALATPGAEFEAFLATVPSPLLVVVNDGTRPTPSADVLAELRPALEGWLRAPGRELAFVIATGTHRVAPPQEVEHIFGADLAKAHVERIFCHDAKDKDRQVHLGRTKRGTEVWVNRLLAEARGAILVNSVEPHYFAATRAAEVSFPRTGSLRDRVGQSQAFDGAGSEHLALEGNPVHEDLQEAMALGIAGKEIYSIQLVLDKDHRIGFASAGALEKTFRDALAVADRQFVLEIDRRHEVVVAVARIPWTATSIRPTRQSRAAPSRSGGGVLIVVSECRFGLGENQTLYDMLAAADSPADALARADGDEYRLGVQQAARIASILAKAEIWVVSSLKDEDVRAMS